MSKDDKDYWGALDAASGKIADGMLDALYDGVTIMLGLVGAGLIVTISFTPFLLAFAAIKYLFA